MDPSLPLPDRLFTVLSQRCGSWLCDQCLGELLTARGAEVSLAVAQLYGDSALRLMQGVCSACLRTDYVVSVPQLHEAA
jgi:hypothetical protein